MNIINLVYNPRLIIQYLLNIMLPSWQLTQDEHFAKLDREWKLLTLQTAFCKLWTKIVSVNKKQVCRAVRILWSILWDWSLTVAGQQEAVNEILLSVHMGQHMEGCIAKWTKKWLQMLLIYPYSILCIVTSTFHLSM